ncbi:DEAD/DEAH box helicase domain containing protein [Theileria equi strain WA]|uniref:DEAD/DEAH box helicase domain containing protein n=1 Tax=Theileria equi strain WA TaxID=1537102 RepID=L0AX21_THEEQ|nr:DEAD/DEAH box helicase domain containing protein [Theileria equi strain WA]AFZ79424.1 DEAD/DEAH box helicase domain containing protein [Theileria equi strain WA]|eukprot:XP_004829090.1 DEAD/DEAH box helicase domain containing protein [Theileria equi strain WA]
MDDLLSMFDAFESANKGTTDVGDYTKGSFSPYVGSGGLDNMGMASSVKLEELEGSNNCTHHRLYPSDYQNEWTKITQMAKEYPFTLDDFQKRSIECLENNESVLVCAHTSAGKTVVAEYAIAMALRDKHRIIYTSPIKALSNQKYRNLSDEFNDVGLMTGDVTLNPNASVMVMTTEILRSMLYRGSEVVQEMNCVIFDEVHYMRDQERGVVWEETIILIPPSVNLVFLSATIPNSLEFAEWVCRIKNSPCNVISTDYRPTPLQHYVFSPGRSGVYLVLDEKRNFKETTFMEAVCQAGPSDDHKKKRSRNAKDIESLIAMCHEKRFTPVIVFAFSKTDCEKNAISVSHMDMTDDAEKALIDEIYRNAMATLSDEDRNLPQALFMLPLLKKGIGIHHGGLLPIIKEIIEIIFQEGLLKVLFSTETFSMGVNMPARTVVFTKLKKWDGRNVRLITSGEYIQMAGRAGRRGLDDRGLVIIMLEDTIKPEEAKKIFLGRADNMDSTFHLGYNMLLNLMRIEDTTPEFMIERSFLQFQVESRARTLEAARKKLIISIQDAKNKIDQNIFPELAAFHLSKRELSKLKDTVSDIITSDPKLLNFLNFGRLVKLVDNDVNWDWGICFASAKLKSKQSKGEKMYVIDCLVLCDRTSVKDGKGIPLPTKDINEGVFTVVPFAVKCVKEISQIRMTIKSDFRVNSEVCQAEMRSKYRQLRDYMSTLVKIPLLDPIEHIKLDSPILDGLLKDIKEKEKIVNSSPLTGRKDFLHILSQYEEYVRLQTEERDLEAEIQKSHQIVMKDELRRMKGVLRALNYVDENGIVTIKGRIACEINATDELVVAELFLRNFFENMQPEYICAALSCLVIDERKDENLPTDLKLLEGFTKIQQVAGDIANVMCDNEMDVNPGAFVGKFKPSLMTVVWRWAKGDTFTDILSESAVFEGSVIRCIRRLEELLRQLACASRNIGNLSMEQVFITCINKLKKGIAFTSSLYL